MLTRYNRAGHSTHLRSVPAAKVKLQGIGMAHGVFPTRLECQVEAHRERIDEILLRHIPARAGALAAIPGPTG